MIAGIMVWAVLMGWLCGGMYAAARVLAREDMPLSVRAGERGARASVPSRIRPALALLVEVSRGVHRG